MLASVSVGRVTMAPGISSSPSHVKEDGDDLGMNGRLDGRGREHARAAGGDSINAPERKSWVVGTSVTNDKRQTKLPVCLWAETSKRKEKGKGSVNVSYS
jgi:hypothetical protein